ncbi:amino acid adenylation domain-containing protein [Roseiflexus sp.]|uniref:amino acid adenylation domain-containing protein n=1 Tax=Roseiflexus sp. TaxID=2562120 RepID=UPI00398A5304
MNSRPVEDIYPLSPMQQGMLFHSLLDPEAGTYIEQTCCVLRGRLQSDIFQRAWQQVVDRHTILRTGFVWEGVATPLQVVYRHVELPFRYEDWRTLPVEERQTHLEAMLAEDRARGVDLGSAPLMRLSLVRVADDVWHFSWVHHHLLIDGWSLPLLLQECFTLYEGMVGGASPSLPPVPPYRVFIEWLQRQDASAAESYWRRALAGFSAPTPLPVGKPGAPTTRHTAEQECWLSRESTARLYEFARQYGLTPGVLVHAAWALLLSRYSGEDDVVFGATVSGRPPDLPAVERMVGLFINTLPVRAQIPPDMPVLKWLHHVRDQLAEMRQYEYTPLVQIHGWSEVPRNQPLFESLLVFENYPMPSADQVWGGDFVIEVIRTSERTNYPLTCVAGPADRLMLKISYDRDRFDEPVIMRMLDHLRTLLEGMVANPDTPLAHLPLLSSAEKRSLLREWGQGGDPLCISCIHRLVEEQAVRTPDAVAVEFRDMRVTYAQLDRQANRLARYLRNHGFGPETIVAICAEPAPETIIGILAILKAGGAYLPLDPSYPSARLRFMIDDARPALLLTQQHLAATLPLDGYPVLLLDDERWTSESDEAVPCDVTPDNLAYVIYTSGSTGIPKGVLVCHGGLTNFVRAQCVDWSIGCGSRVLQFASLSFDASAAEIFTALTSGATLCLAPRAVLASVEDLHRLLRDAAITTVTLPPSLLAVLPSADLPTLQTVAAAGEACSWEAALKWANGRRFFNAYGPTETTIGPAWGQICDRIPGTTTAPIGRPIPGMAIYLLDRHREPVPVGVPGEIWVSGAGVTRGYLNRPDLTAERFITIPAGAFGEGIPPHPQRLYRTGDLARWLPDATLEYLGRYDDQVKLRGFRVEPGEIAAVLHRHPTVSDAVVVVREDRPGDRRLVAYVRPASVDVATVRTWLKNQLPEYMVPTAIVALDAWPLTPGGKVDRAALPAPNAGVETGVQDALCSPAEELLAGIWADVLGLTHVGAHDDFFDLGGHSLNATQVIGRARDAFGLDIPLRWLFETRTVAELAARIEQERRAARGATLLPLTRAKRTGDLPLSYAQQRLWFLDRLEPESALYNNPAIVRLRGRLDIAAFECSLNEIVRRHEAMRTSFAMINGRPVQRIAPELLIELPLVDLSRLPMPERDAEARRLATEMAEQPFDLARGPLVRAMLLRLTEDDHIAVLVTHHIVSDGWSVGVLVRELAALYSAFIKGCASPLPQLPLQYADYAVWQRSWMEGDSALLEHQIAYWKEQLAGAAPLLDLPTDRPRPPIATFHGAEVPFALSREMTQALQRLSASEGATLFMTLLAAFKVLLARYSGQNDICIGTPIAGRTRTETEDLIGFFVNTLVLRTRYRGDLSFVELLQQVRETALAAYAHQDVPFEMLVEVLRPERRLNYAPLFQVMLVLDTTPRAPITLPDMTIEPFPLDRRHARFDLTLELRVDDDGVGGAFEYNTDLFDAATIEAMARRFHTLLAAVVADPEQRVADLQLLTDSERQCILVEWNRTDTPFPHQHCIHDLFESHAAALPDHPAVTFESATLGYAELNRYANQIAHTLQQRGVGPETLVGIAVERSIPMVAGILGVLKAGAAFLPLDPAYPPERLRFMIEDARPAAILTQAHLASSSWVAQSRTQADVILLDADHERIVCESTDTPVCHATPDSLAYVIYTSGSTGVPKGTLLHHRGLCNLAIAQQQVFGVKPGDRVLQFSALSFDAAVWELVMALCSGATLCLASQETLTSAPALLRLLRDRSISIVTLPPSLLAVLPPEDLPELTTVIAAGERCSRELVARWGQGRRFFNAYGPTETTVCASIALCNPDDPRDPPIGRPIANTRLFVLDEHRQPVPVGTPGELYIAGVGVARAYLNRPDLTAERFVELDRALIGDPPVVWHATPARRRCAYRTGDRVRWRRDGQLEFLERLDQQVKVRGFRIEPGEVEAALRSHTAVADALVLARNDRLLAYVIPSSGHDADDGAAFRHELRAFLAERLPGYMVPSAIVELQSWPLTPGGKIDRAALPDPEWLDAPGSEYVAPRTPTEEALTAICAELLGIPQVGVNDNFFEIGGHSLLATQLLARVQARWGVDVPLRTLFNDPAIATLAAAIDEAVASGAVHTDPPIAPVARATRRVSRAALLQNGLEEEEVDIH